MSGRGFKKIKPHELHLTIVNSPGRRQFRSNVLKTVDELFCPHNSQLIDSILIYLNKERFLTIIVKDYSNEDLRAEYRTKNKYAARNSNERYFEIIYR